MIYFDLDRIEALIEEYNYFDGDGKNTDICYELTTAWDKLKDLYCGDEVNRVINAFQDCSLDEFGDAEYNAENVKAIKKVKSPDIAFIAAYVGFIFGALYAENSRLHFCED